MVNSSGKMERGSVQRFIGYVVKPYNALVSSLRGYLDAQNSSVYQHHEHVDRFASRLGKFVSRRFGVDLTDFEPRMMIRSPPRRIKDLFTRGEK